MQIISAGQVMQAMDMSCCIQLMEQALISLTNGDSVQIVRPVLPLYDQNLIGMMPVYYKPLEIAGVKVLSVFPKNFLNSIPSHQGQLVLFETKTGSVKAIVDADSLTGIRTAAVSAAVTDMLANTDASNLAILGAGLQGRKHLEAISLIRNIEQVYVWDIRPEASSRYAKEMSDMLGIPIQVCDTAKAAVETADIICTLTPSIDPIISLDDVMPGAHINAVGACSPHSRELASDLVAASKLFVDWIPATVREAGDYILALEENVINKNHILGEVGQVLSGAISGRTCESDITLFEALGQAIQDLLVANYIADKLNA